MFEVDPRYGKNQCDDAERRAYFNSLREEIANGGREAMMWDLLHRPIDDWDAEAFPITTALMKQKRQTLRGFDKAFEGWLQTGVLPRTEWWEGRDYPNCAPTEAMIKDVRRLRGMEHEADAAMKGYLKEFENIELRTSVATSESDYARAHCGDLNSGR